MVKSKLEIHERDFWTCQRCKKVLTIFTAQQAHLIKQGNKRSKKNQTVKTIFNFVRRKYNVELANKEIWKIIDDESNIVTSCDQCNSSFNIFNKTIEMEKKISAIYEKLYI